MPVKMTYSKHAVKKGENLHKISAAHGFDAKQWRKLYELKVNSAFRKKRKDPNHIEPGDVLFVPDFTREQLFTARKRLIELYDSNMSMSSPVSEYKARIERLKKVTESLKATASISKKQKSDSKKAMYDAEKALKNASKWVTLCKLGGKDDHLNPFVALMICKAETDRMYKAFAIHYKKQKEMLKASKQYDKDDVTAKKAAVKVWEETRQLPKLVSEWRAGHKKVAGILKTGILDIESIMGDTF